MSTAALACQLEDFKKLDNLPFYKQANGYADEVLKEMPNHVIPTYIYLREQSNKNYKKRGVVAQSNSKIAKGAKRSARTIQRHLALLQELGYIRFIETYRGKYRVNYIEVTCPQAVLERLLSTHKQINCIKKYATPMSYYHDTDVVHNNRIIDKPIINTNIRETSPLCDLEPVCEAVEYPLEYPLQNEPVEQNVPRETFLGDSEAQNFKGVEFDRFKTEAEVARFITKAERKQIVTKVKAMKRDGEIHPKVQANYQDIMVLVNHIIIHCVYRKKFKSFKHSLRSAATGLRNGTWTTPKRVLAAETAERERLANEAKEQERRQCLESGFGRILGEAMRLTHGPSEADLARAKAQAVNEVVQAVGNNRAADYLQKIKDILKKPTERKEEERKK